MKKEDKPKKPTIAELERRLDSVEILPSGEVREKKAVAPLPVVTFGPLAEQQMMKRLRGVEQTVTGKAIAAARADGRKTVQVRDVDAAFDQYPKVPE